VKNKILLGLSLILVLGGPSALSAQSRRVKTEPAFTAFWVKFKEALARNDRARIVEMTKLPFMIGGEDLDRKGLLKEYPKLFHRSTRRCFAREKPLKENDYYEIFCGETIFLFGKVDDVWKFAEIGAND
jgi:hypothetical protein